MAVSHLARDESILGVLTTSYIAGPRAIMSPQVAAPVVFGFEADALVLAAYEVALEGSRAIVAMDFLAVAQCHVSGRWADVFVQDPMKGTCSLPQRQGICLLPVTWWAKT